MSTVTKEVLSGSTDGKQIKISATSSGGANTIHTAGSGTTNKDELWVWVTNNHTSAVNLTLLLGGTASPDDEINMSVPSKSGVYLVLPGFILQNSLILKAFAGTTNVLCISGFVNRIAP